MRRPATPEMFHRTLFDSTAVRLGAGIRRKVRDVERLAGRAVFVEDLRHRGFSVVENAGQFVDFCNAEPIRRIT